LAPKDHSLDVTVGQHDFAVSQSPALLQSSRAEGTTGAVLWRSSLHLAQWLLQPEPLTAADLLKTGNTAVELGAGSAGITTVILAKCLVKGDRVLATDTGPSLKLLQQNVNAHVDVLSRGRPSSEQRSAPKADLAEIAIASLNWEHDDAASLLTSHGVLNGSDLVLSCDCIYNYALIRPFLDTCKELCLIRSNESFAANEVTVNSLMRSR
jgi:hypothetical protein